MFADSTKIDLLYLAHRVPYPPDKGDRIRSYNILRYLAQQANIHLATFADEPVPAATLDHLHELCVRVKIIPLGKARWLHAFGSLLTGSPITTGAFQSSAMTRELAHWSATTKFSATLASASSMVPYLQTPALKDVPALVDLVDVDSQKWFDYAGKRSWPLSSLYHLEGQRLRVLEQDLSMWAKAITLVSEPEARLFRSFANGTRVHAVTNGVDLDYFTPDETIPQQNTCVFVGAFDYYPNVEGAIWFCREVWPTIHARFPHLKWQLVGRNPVPAVRQLQSIPGVEVVGSVPDVRPYVAAAKLALIPLRIARGLQNKVIEAMAMAKPVIASPNAVAALAIQPGNDLLTATTAEEWIATTTELLSNDRQRQNLAQAGRSYVEKHHDWNTCLEPLGQILQQTIVPAPQTPEYATITQER